METYDEEILTTADDATETSWPPTISEYLLKLGEALVLEIEPAMYQEADPLARVTWNQLAAMSRANYEYLGVYQALRRIMLLRMLKPIGSIKEIRQRLLSHVSFIFGMCCSQLSLILNAFFGNSLSRIPSL